MFDIDHFKKINDLHGHQGGDAALCFVSQTLKKVLRESDVAGRYGGEEFAVTLVDTDLNGAKIFAERLRQTIEQSVIHYEESEITLTISIGIAEYTDTYQKYEQWIESADQALYRSKEGGRNQVNVAE